MSTVEIPLSRGQVAVVDAADIEAVNAHKWHAVPRGSITFYAGCTGEHGRIYLHRFLMNPGPGLCVDHINGDGLDNRRSNLRICTNAENSRNLIRIQSNNTSGFTGVYHYPKRNRPYRAAIVKDRVMHSVGYFFTPEDAARARDKAALELFGPLAFFNFPEEVAA